MAGLAAISQTDFSGGLWSSSTPERIPANGVAGAQNVLVDDTGGLYRRGGATNFAGSGWPATQILWVWQGALTGGNRTLFATSTNLYSINGGTITNVGAYTGMPVANRPAVLSGIMYLPNGKTYDGTTFGTPAAGELTRAFLATVSNRLIGAQNSVVSFSGVGTTTFAATDFWLIPGGATISGVTPLRDALVVFSDQGTWVISNLALKLTDAAGNVQQRLDLYSPDMMLWGIGNAGVVGYQGGLIVPARDGVWLMRLGTTSEVSAPLELLSRPITSLYRAYVAAGYQPGQAAVFRGHYFLPILNGATLIDFLVCRLDLPSRPWTSFANYGAALALTTSQDGQTLIGVTDKNIATAQLATLSYLDTSVQVDGAGGNIIAASVTSRDFLSGSLTQNTVSKVRVGYRLAKLLVTSSASVSYGGSVDTGVPTSLGSLPSTAGAFSTTTLPVGKRTRAARFKVAIDISGSATLQSLEVFVRRSGRQ